ncbi:protein transport protein HofB-like protein, pili/fimbriae biogenesis protein [Actinobacillus pleuropneumoniae]|nr:protein transport protein HofB-like protein, pili/fimbriae biogenesis protein [Actinobacillus pleuropneumoniae]
MQYSVCDVNNRQVFRISEEQWQKNYDERHILLRYLTVRFGKTNKHYGWQSMI